MKVLLVSLNAKYIHSSLALRSIRDYCKDYKKITKILELTINQDENQIIKQIYQEKPDVVGFSCYIWNMGEIKKIVLTLKKIMPEIKIVLGGPEVSYQSTDLLETLPVDIIMEGEGEATWDEYLHHLTQGTPALSEIGGILSKDSNSGKISINPSRPLLEMDTLPFVYHTLEGLEHRIIYYEASRGCPFNCQYCLSSIEKGVRFLPLERVKKELQYFLDHRVMQVKFVDRTFNTKKDYALEIWQYLIINDNGYTNFHFEIAAELLDEALLEHLKEARPGLIQFEIGVQSTNEDVLKIIKRGMPFHRIERIASKIKSLGNIHQHLDLIAGLPLEDYQSFRNSFNDVISLRPEQFQLGFLKLLKGSGLRQNAQTYGIVYKDEPPYEVLYTEHLSYEEILKLHNIEEMLERYYNSERFKGALEYCYTLFDSPFDFYESLAAYWAVKGYDQVSHKKAAYYIYLAEFGQTLPTVNLELLKELIRLDWFSHEYLKEVPTQLRTLNQETYKNSTYDFLKEDEKLRIGGEHLIQIPIRQRTRQVHIEHFSYAVYEWMKSAYKQNPALLVQPQAILFDYTSRRNEANYLKVEV